MAGKSAAQTVLVTGASGFIAAHVTQQLLRAGYRVRGTVRSLQNEAKVEPLRKLCPDAKHELELVEADLLKPDSWKSAVEGCSHVIHVASPFPNAPPKDENSVCKPAVEGTTSVFKACEQAGTVKRVVLTSSFATVSGGLGTTPNYHYTENDWPDPDKMLPYEKSKLLAEKAGWDYVKNMKGINKFELAVMNPGLVLGPILSGTYCTSMEVPKRLMLREMPALPKIILPIVDVRDVAEAHIRAMTLPEAVGQRHMLISGSMWMLEMALVLQKEFKSQGYKIPTLIAPKLALQIASLFDPTLKYLIPSLEIVASFDKKRFTDVLGIKPIKNEDSLIEMAYSMIENGFLPKKPAYRKP
ncbi:uncharacterized protein [Ptychodera flava]|uniref:uncharacterized protein n=1 Tax=Ptychodera flava TaxID=63121 RepID=UPI00396A9BD1